MATTRLELSAQLRQATILAHDNVRKPTLVAYVLIKTKVGRSRLTSSGLTLVRHLEAGTLDRRIYLAYLSRLETIYSALEQALARHPSHPHLATTHHPALLARAPALANDCAYFREELGVESSRGGEVAARAYCERLSVLGESSESDVVSLLLAHSYVRYRECSFRCLFVDAKVRTEMLIHTFCECSWRFIGRTSRVPHRIKSV